MVFEQKTWYNDGVLPDDVPKDTVAPFLDADNLNRLEKGIVEAITEGENTRELFIKKDIGFISFYCNPTPPSGWLICDGSAISRDVYADLYACIGDSFGAGDGSTTFNLPDLRGEFIRGWNSSQSGIDANRGFGTKQQATRFSNDWMGSRYISDGENSGSTQTSSGGAAHGEYEDSIRIRPNNIALLPCIFTGVFN